MKFNGSRFLCLLSAVSFVSYCAKKKEEDEIIKTPAELAVHHDSKVLDTYEFGGLPFGDSRSVTLEIENTGEKDATVGTLAFADSSSVALTAFNYTGGTFPGTGGDCTATILGKSKCNISISYTAPTGTAYTSSTQSGFGTLNYNNGNEDTKVTFAVSGTARTCANGSESGITQIAYNSGSATSHSTESNFAAQSFTFSTDKYLKKVKLSQYKGAGATYSGVKISIFASASNAPSGTALATYTFSDPGLIESSRASFTYTLTTPFEATAGTEYWMAVSYPGLTGGYVFTDKETSDVASSGNYASSNDGSTWTAISTSDLTHSIETCVADTTLDASATYGISE